MVAATPAAASTDISAWPSREQNTVIRIVSAIAYDGHVATTKIAAPVFPARSPSLLDPRRNTAESNTAGYQ